MKYDELFGDIHTLALLYDREIIYTDVYSNVFAKYYDTLPRESFECDNYLDEAYCCGKRVLELCCGTGRLTTIFAKKGFVVDGVDISKDMLTILEEKRRGLPKSVARNLNIICDDVFSYCPQSEKYDFVFLPATTICILSEQDELIAKLFRNISAMLKPTGSFMFDMRCYGTNMENKCSELFLSTVRIDEKPAMVLMQENLQYDISRAIGNFYLEVVEGNGYVKRYITTTNKRMVSIDDLSESIMNAGLYLHRKTTIVAGMNSIDLFTLKKVEN